MRNILLWLAIAAFAVSCKPPSHSFLKTEGRHFASGEGEYVLLRGIGIG